MQSVSPPMDISVILPCLNEEESLPFVLEQIRETLSALPHTFEIIVADNNSTDGSVQIAEKYGARIIHVSKKGYGSTLSAGIRAAQGNYIIFADADGSYDFTYIPTCLTYLMEGYDMVSGSRLRGTIEQDAMPPLHRYIGTPLLTFLINTFFGTNITDSNSGLKGLTKKVATQMIFKSEGMEFISEIVLQAALHKFTIKEFPIHFYKDKRTRKPHLRTWRDGLRNLSLILYYVYNKKNMGHETE